MPREFSEDPERNDSPEYKEYNENKEVDEIRKSAEKLTSEVSEELEHNDTAEHIAEQAIGELREMDSEAERAEELAKDVMEELDGFEENLGHKLDDVREELHEEFVDDMDEKLGETSLEDSTTETKSDAKGETNEEIEVSSESYIEGNDGMVYAIESGEAPHTETEVETEEMADTHNESVTEVSNCSNNATNEIGESITPSETQVSETERTCESEKGEHPQQVSETEEVHCNETPDVESKKKTVSEKEANEIHDGESTDTIEETSRHEIQSIETKPSPERDDELIVDSEGQLHREESSPENSMESLDETEESESLQSDAQAELVETNAPILENDESEILEISEELTSKIDELLEDFELPDEQEVDESRIIVDAMTGEEHLDTSLEPRPYFAESEEDIEEKEQENIREKLMELFSSLTEEEREEFKRATRSEIETEDDLEELVKEWYRELVSPDLKQKVEESREYIRKKKSGDVPQLFREIWALEVERAWTHVVGTRMLNSTLRRMTSSERAKARTKKKVKKKRKTGYHRGRVRMIKLHGPMRGKRPIASFESYKRWLESNYPSFCIRDDYHVLLEQVRKFFELRKALGKRTTIRQFELDEIAEQVGLKPSTARDWTFNEQIPHLFQIVDSTLSKREAQLLRLRILKAAGGIGQWSELEVRLRQIYPGESYKKIAQYRSKESRVKEFFAFLRELELGGTQKGIARRTGISQRRVRAFRAGEVPWLIRHVLSVVGMLKPTMRYKSHSASVYKTRIRFTKVRGQEIHSYAEFKRLVDREFPWLKERSDYTRLMAAVRAYFESLRKFSSQTHITRNEIVEFVKEKSLSVEAVIEWMKGRSLPMVFNMLKDSLSVSEAKKELDKILALLNGVVSLEAYEKRMRTCYISNLLKSLQSYKNDYAQVKEFFRFLKALEKGGLYTDIIGRGNLEMGNTKQRLLYKKFPRLIGIANSIPASPPQRGYRWLPLKINKRGKPERFIQVPLSINKVSDLTNVISQLTPLLGKKMKAWIMKFDEIPRDIAFMYLLGALASDGTFDRRNGTSTSVSISLSTKYPWSMIFGEAFCYYLGIFGFGSNRNKNSFAKNKAGEDIEMMNWKGSASPFMMWIRNTLLGLRLDTSKSDQPLNANWILEMPSELILPFLQGMADGDGYATVRSLITGISSKHNKEFIQKALTRLGIRSMDCGNSVGIARKKSLKIAAQLPLFRYATGRLFRLRVIVEMLSSVKYSRISAKERRRILKYYKQGVKINQIGSLLWVDFGKLRRSSVVTKVIKDAGL